MKLLHVVQHTSAEYLGLMEDHLEGRNLRFRYHRPFTGKVPPPRPEAVKDGLILLGGGPWGSAGGRDVPTLTDEVALARACLQRGCPVVGIGLGAQILARAAGGGAEPGALRFEVTRARRTKDGALAGYLPAEYPLVIYMRDFPLPPPHAEVLAEDAGGRPALWRAAKNALGFTGHPGLKVAMVEDLIMEFEEAPEDFGPALDALRLAQPEIEEALVPIMAGLVRLAEWM